MKKNLTACFLLFLTFGSIAQIKVSDNERFLATKENMPFFWLGDTDWEMFHRLTREEAVSFIETRSRQGFNILQAVALAEMNGVRTPNRYGDIPLKNEDPTQLLITEGNDTADADQYDYWDHVDFIINEAAAKGMYIGLLPTWGDKVARNWGDGPSIFNESNAKAYGAILAKRYGKLRNVLWILGGDRPAVYKRDEKEWDDRPIWRAMAAGIEEVCGKEAFITYHPSGGKYRTSDYVHAEPWLDMNAFQSGHGSREADPWNWVKEDIQKDPQKPTLDMEPCYEDHPVNPWDGKWTRERGYFTAYDVRARIYRGVFAGACGVTYGHHQVWQFLNRDLYEPINVGDTLIGWQKASIAPAATEMIHLKNLMLSRPYFSRIADQTMIHSQNSSNYVELILATRDQSGRYAMVYLPQNKAVKIDVTKISGKKKNAWWFDVRTGKATAGGTVGAEAIQSFKPPVGEKDWVLVIDDASQTFGPPGQLSAVHENRAQ